MLIYPTMDEAIEFARLFARLGELCGTNGFNVEVVSSDYETVQQVFLVSVATSGVGDWVFTGLVLLVAMREAVAAMEAEACTPTTKE